VPDRRALIRRRRRNLLAGALAAFALGIAVGASSGDDGDEPRPRPADGAAPPAAGEPGRREAAEAVDRLTLRQQVGQLLILRFAGTTPPPYVREALRGQRAAGAILFRDNVVDAEQLRALTGALRGASDAGGRSQEAAARPLVAVDQEGGDIRIVPWAPPAASAPEQAAAGSVRADAEAAGAELRRLGITVSLAPVGDVPSVDGAALAGRAFATEPGPAGEAMADAVAGWRAGGVAATAKHFPGLGGAAVNTDDAPATVDRTRAQLEATDLPPFTAAIEAGVPLVMVGHGRYPALDPDRIASQSAPIIQELLRERLGFRGVVITDSMEAQASLATGAIEAVSERAVRAGADLLLLTGRGSYTPVYEHLAALAERSPAFRARVRDAAARVLALKRDGAQP
jgi:beta-N-acetylhexosaminidase